MEGHRRVVGAADPLDQVGVLRARQPEDLGRGFGGDCEMLRLSRPVCRLDAPSQVLDGVRSPATSRDEGENCVESNGTDRRDAVRGES